MYTASGSLPTSWSVSLAKDGPVTYSTGFQANRVYYAGTAEIDPSGTVANSGESTVTVISPKRHASDSAATAEDIAWYHSATIGARFTLKNNGSVVVDGSGNTTIFEVSSVNKFWVKLYAKLFNKLINTFPKMHSICVSEFKNLIKIFYK